MADLVDIRLHQHALAHEIYRQQILQRLPDPYPNMLPPRHVAMPRMLQGVDAKLQNSDLWKQFHQIGTEMIITKSGRRMFPSLRLALAGLEDDVNYCVLLEMVPVGDCRYKFSGSQWVPAGGAEPQSPQRMYLHQDSPALGSHWTAQPIIFNKVKLTNNTLDNSGHIVLTSMHKYQPRLHIVRASDPSQIPWSAQKGFTFPETEFVAVTAYQNDRITKLKIDNNPFAKGFRETGQSRCKRKQLTNSSKTEENQDIEIGIKRMRPDSSACSISSLDDSGRSTSESSSGTSSPDNISRKHHELQNQLQYSSSHFSNPSWMDLAFSYLTRPYSYFPTPQQSYEFLPSFGTSAVPSYPPMPSISHQQIQSNQYERSEIPLDEKSVDLTIKPPKKCSFSISAILGCDR